MNTLAIRILRLLHNFRKFTADFAKLAKKKVTKLYKKQRNKFKKQLFIKFWIEFWMCFVAS